MMRSCRLLALPLLAVLVLASGCRTYGDSQYDNAQKMRQQMLQAVRQFDDELGRARADLELLEDAAQQQPALAPLVERYQQVVDSHEATLADHDSLARRMQDAGSYRKLHETYGAMVTDQRLVNRQYDRTVRQVRAVVQGEEIERGASGRKSDYYIEPTEYKREQNADRLTMEEALQGGAGDASSAPADR
jgi:hypothetical protein